MLRVNENGWVGIVGVLSNGGSSCVGRDNYVRLTTIVDWIEATQDEHGSSPCGELTWEGECLDGRSIWCEGDHIQAMDCEGKDLCGWDIDQVGYRCVSDLVDPCRGVGTSGRCEDQTLLACDRGKLVKTDCSACGKDCVWGTRQAACE